MKMMCCSHVYLAFLLGAISELYLEVRASATDAPLGMTGSPAILTSQNPTSQEPTEQSTVLTTTVSQDETTSATQTSTLQPASPTETSIFQLTSPTETSASATLPPTLPPQVSTSFYATATTKAEDQATANKAEVCEESSKRLMLICFVIIGALVFICVLLLLVIVVLASKVSHLKRRQPSKRLPRSNGDFLSGNSLWPLGLETLQRTPNETTGTDPKVQGPGPERTNAGHEQFEEAGKKLAREISNRQKHREMPAKSNNDTTTRVEI